MFIYTYIHILLETFSSIMSPIYSYSSCLFNPLTIFPMSCNIRVHI